MKKAFLAASVLASAAMMVSAANAADVAPAGYDWTGIYFGVNAGAAFNNSELNNDLRYTGTVTGVQDIVSGFGNNLNGDDTAFTGGAMLGYNWQMDALVLGVETDFNYLGFSGSSSRDLSDGASTLFGEPVTASHKLSYEADWYGTLRGRLGFAADNLLFYGTGGLAYGHMSADSRAHGSNADGDTASWSGSTDSVNWGWTVGAGMEYGIDNWSLGVEYLYVDLGSDDWSSNANVSSGVGPGGAILDDIKGNADFDYQFSVVRATAKLRF